jgi:hypothetical protein
MSMGSGMTKKIDPAKDDGLPYTEEYIDAGMPGWPARVNVTGSEVMLGRKSSSANPRSESSDPEGPEFQSRYSENPSPQSGRRKKRIARSRV